jgi:hypothetical protein
VLKRSEVKYLFVIISLLVAVGCGESKVASDPVLSELVHSPGWDAVQIADREESIGQCMRKGGFRYFVMKTKSGGSRRPSTDLPSPNQLEDVGYGISASMSGASPSLTLRFWQDPRQTEYLSSLSSAEERAYYSDLYGSKLADLAVGGREVAVVRGVGCAGLAIVSGTKNENLQSKLQSNWAQSESAFRSDRRVLVLQAEWSTCMTAEGFQYRDRYQIVNELMERSGRLMSNGGTASSDFSKLSNDEIRISLADAKCLGKHYEQLMKIWSSYEETFRTQFAEELEVAAGLVE